LTSTVKMNKPSMKPVTQPSSKILAKDKTNELDDLSRTINDLDSEIKTRRREKDELKARLSNLQISFKREQNNGTDAEATNHAYDVLIRQKNVQMGQKQNELETFKEEIEKSLNQNSYLTNDVETVKKNIESLISINKDVNFFALKDRFWRR
jgi:chromosome segregation ATPase